MEIELEGNGATQQTEAEQFLEQLIIILDLFKFEVIEKTSPLALEINRLCWELKDSRIRGKRMFVYPCCGAIQHDARPERLSNGHAIPPAPFSTCLWSSRNAPAGSIVPLLGQFNCHTENHFLVPRYGGRCYRRHTDFIFHIVALSVQGQPTSPLKRVIKPADLEENLTKTERFIYEPLHKGILIALSKCLYGQYYEQLDKRWEGDFILDKGRGDVVTKKTRVLKDVFCHYMIFGLGTRLAEHLNSSKRPVKSQSSIDKIFAEKSKIWVPEQLTLALHRCPDEVWDPLLLKHMRDRLEYINP